MSKRERVQAIAAHGLGHGVVLYATPGSELASATFEDDSCHTLNIYGMPDGLRLAVWEGEWHTKPENPAGTWRALTGAEWSAVREGRNPLAPLYKKADGSVREVYSGYVLRERTADNLGDFLEQYEEYLNGQRPYECLTSFPSASSSRAVQSASLCTTGTDGTSRRVLAEQSPAAPDAPAGPKEQT